MPAGTILHARRRPLDNRYYVGNGDKMNSFFRESKQRKVYCIALGYAVVAWLIRLIIRVSAMVMPAYQASDWILPILITPRRHRSGWEGPAKRRTIWIIVAHRDGKRFIVRGDEKLTAAFVELESDTRVRGEFDLVIAVQKRACG